MLLHVQEGISALDRSDRIGQQVLMTALDSGVMVHYQLMPSRRTACGSLDDR
jgi:hypothetical protein